MEYTTLDMEWADVCLPSICSIAILDWKDGEVVSSYYHLVCPDCDYDERLSKRHGLTKEDTSSMPSVSEIWKEIYDHLDGKTVFVANACSRLRSLCRLADSQALRMPNMVYGDVLSLARRCWPWLPCRDLEQTAQRLQIVKKAHEARQDAWAIGRIVEQALAERGLADLDALFDQVGFAGGVVSNGLMIPYRAGGKKQGHYKACFTGVLKGFVLQWPSLARCYPGPGGHASLPLAGSLLSFVAPLSAQ